ncbi:MAG TPA: DUF2585 family protein [Dongiaceae bacterium]|nr:DUF2585 family protein [Dongiaceae bacterium]
MGSLQAQTEPAAVQRRHGWVIIACLFVPLVTAGIELLMGRSPLGPDGKFGLWEGDIWSAETSQRLADPYSFSHFIHGILFYAGFWLLARKLPRSYRLLAALLLEAGWELLENSPLIINRYRETTIALGYVGDSVLNSVSDILMMTLGFLFASRVSPKICVTTILVLEIGCALWVRDNLTLNIIMLIYPVAAIKQWQLANAPVR